MEELPLGPFYWLCSHLTNVRDVKALGVCSKALYALTAGYLWDVEGYIETPRVLCIICNKVFLTLKKGDKEFKSRVCRTCAEVLSIENRRLQCALCEARFFRVGELKYRKNLCASCMEKKFPCLGCKYIFQGADLVPFLKHRCVREDLRHPKTVAGKTHPGLLRSCPACWMSKRTNICRRKEKLFCTRVDMFCIFEVHKATRMGIVPPKPK